MKQRVKFWELETVTVDGRMATTRRPVWDCWADIYTASSSRKPSNLETLQDNQLAFDVRRCEASDAIRRKLTRHAAAYEVTFDGVAYTLAGAEYSRNDRAKIAFRAAASE